MKAVGAKNNGDDVEQINADINAALRAKPRVRVSSVGLDALDTDALPVLTAENWDHLRPDAPRTLDEEMAESPGTALDDDSNGDKLNKLVNKALDTMAEVLNTELPATNSPDRLKVLSIKKDAAVSVLGAGLKADENRFRKRQSDVLGRLLDALRSEENTRTIENATSVHLQDGPTYPSLPPALS